MKIQILDKRIIDLGISPASPGAAGLDLRASIPEPITIQPHDTELFPAGIKIALLSSWVGLIFPRSGLSKEGIVLGNGIGVIDSDFRGQIHILLRNLSGSPRTIMPMDRIAQLLVIPFYNPECIEYTLDNLGETSRGSGGFGSTGMK